MSGSRSSSAVAWSEEDVDSRSCKEYVICRTLGRSMRRSPTSTSLEAVRPQPMLGVCTIEMPLVVPP